MGGNADAGGKDNKYYNFQTSWLLQGIARVATTSPINTAC